MCGCVWVCVQLKWPWGATMMRLDRYSEALQNYFCYRRWCWLSVSAHTAHSSWDKVSALYADFRRMRMCMQLSATCFPVTVRANDNQTGLSVTSARGRGGGLSGANKHILENTARVSYHQNTKSVRGRDVFFKAQWKTFRRNSLQPKSHFEVYSKLISNCLKLNVFSLME